MHPLLVEMAQEQVVAIIRGTVTANTAGACEALWRAGLRFLEVTFTIPETGKAIEAAKAACPEARVGAGTITSGAQAVEAVAAGAEFLVTPGLVPEAAEVAGLAGVPILMGTTTVSEVLTARSLGCEGVKIFPCFLLGPEYVKAIRGLVPDLLMMCTGGVNPENARSFLEAGAEVVGFGTEVAAPRLMDEGNFAELEARARTGLQKLRA